MSFRLTSYLCGKILIIYSEIYLFIRREGGVGPSHRWHRCEVNSDIANASICLKAILRSGTFMSTTHRRSIGRLQLLPDRLRGLRETESGSCGGVLWELCCCCGCNDWAEQIYEIIFSKKSFDRFESLTTFLCSCLFAQSCSACRKTDSKDINDMIQVDADARFWREKVWMLWIWRTIHSNIAISWYFK